VGGQNEARVSVRDRSRITVLAKLREHGVVSQAQIARETGLSRTTVSGVVAELRDQGLLVDVDPGDGRPRSGSRGGRPPVFISLTHEAGAVIGIDFGHSHVRVIAANLGHSVLAERERPFRVDGDAVGALDIAAELVEEVILQAGLKRSMVLGAAMGVPGPVDRERGTVASNSILPGWVGVHAAQEMRRRIRLPVEVDNDANLGALAEYTMGAGRGCSELAYVKLSTGIGCGLVLRGRPYRGASGTAGEIGHTCIDEGGQFCYCGNRGCLETLASGSAVVGMLRRAYGDDLTLSQVLLMAAAGELACRRAIEDAGRHVGVAVANLCNMVNPQRVVVGGQLSLAADILLEPLRDSFRRYAVQAAAETVEIVAGQLGERAEAIGALAFGMRTFEPVLARRR
jgi:predicted NBD/HSP70 family sugar kinase/biotin operon repressor